MPGAYSGTKQLKYEVFQGW